MKTSSTEFLSTGAHQKREPSVKKQVRNPPSWKNHSLRKLSKKWVGTLSLVYWSLDLSQLEDLRFLSSPPFFLKKSFQRTFVCPLAYCNKLNLDLDTEKKIVLDGQANTDMFNSYRVKEKIYGQTNMNMVESWMVLFSPRESRGF